MLKVRPPLFVLLGIAILFVCVASSVTSWLITYSYSRRALLDLSKSLRNEISMEMSLSVTSMFTQPSSLLFSMQNAINVGLIDVGTPFEPLNVGDTKAKIKPNDPAAYMQGIAKRLGKQNSVYLINDKGFFWYGSQVDMISISNCTNVVVNGTCLRRSTQWYPNKDNVVFTNSTYDASVRPWYKSTPRIPGQFFMTPVFVRYQTTVLMATNTQALFSKAGEYQATVAFDNSVEDLSDSLKKFNVSNSTLLCILQDEPRLPFIANRNGNYTNMANKDLLMGVYESENEEIKNFGIELRDHHYPMLSDSQSFETKNVAWEVRRITIGGLSMLLCVGLDKKELMEPIVTGNKLTSILVTVVTAGLVLLGMALGWFIARSLTRLCDLLERASEMKVESYAQKDAYISEVYIIQQSVAKLIKELKEYKAYMPAALFKGDSDSDSDDGMPVPLPQETNMAAGDSDSETNRSKTTNKSSGKTRSSSHNPHIPAKKRRASLATDGSANSSSKAYRKTKHSGQLTTKDVTVMCVTAVGFVERLHQFDNTIASQLLNKMFDAVHSVAAPKKGHIELSSNGQVIVSWNAHSRCIDHADTAASCALQLKSKLEELYETILTEFGSSCKFTVALASGQALCGVVGNDAARIITTIGVPVAATQTTANCIDDMHSNVLVVCDPTASRLKYSFVLKPIDTLLYSHLKKMNSYRQPITLYEVLQQKATGKDAEWMYQLQDMEQAQSAYNKLFTAVSTGELDITRSLSQVGEYLAGNTSDLQALRLGVILEQTKGSGGTSLMRTVVPWKLCSEVCTDQVQVSVL